MAARKCIICSESFSARRDAKTCSVRCRKRLQLVRFDLLSSRVGGRARSVARGLSLLIVGVVSLFSLFAASHSLPKATAATSDTINFQARLLTSAGNTVPDGNYSIEFKLYTADTGGSPVWTETRNSVGVNQVRVVNGYMTVNLGSVTAFSGINWDQQHWLTMNIYNPSTPGWDGEMSPRLKLTAVPYAFTAGTLSKTTGANRSTLDFDTQTGSHSILLPDEGGTLCIQSSTNCNFAAATGSSAYIQNTTSPQTANFNITGNGVVGGNLTVNGTGLFANSTNSTAAFQIQNALGSNALVVDTTSLNSLLTNGNFENADVSAWTAKGTVTSGPSRDATRSYLGAASLTVNAGTNQNGGIKYVTSLSAVSYTLSFSVRQISGTAFGSNFSVGWNNGTSDTDCALTPGGSSAFGIQNQGVPTTGWNRFSCTFTGSASGHLYWKQSDTPASGRTFNIDAVQLELGTTSTAFKETGLQLNGLITSVVNLQNAADSTGALMVNSAAGANVLRVDTLNNFVGIGDAVKRGTEAFGVTGDGRFTGTVTAGGYTINNLSVVTQTVFGGNPALQIGDTSGYWQSLTLVAGSAIQANIGSNGATTFKNSADSTTAFQIQSNAGSSLFNADSTNMRIGIGPIGGFSDTPVKLSDPATPPAGNSFGTAFSPDGVYMSVAHSTSPFITIYKRSGDTFTKLADPATLPAGNATATAWSPDGTYMTVGHATSPFITIYKRSGDTFTKLADPATLPASAGTGVAFSRDGVYMSVSHASSPYVTIYKRSGDTFTKLTDPATLPGATGNAVAFSPDSTYMSVISTSSPYITIYKRSGDTFTKLTDPASLPIGQSSGVAFSPDNTYMSVSVVSGTFGVVIYKRSGDTFTKLTDPTIMPTNAGWATAFSPDGLYMSVAHSVSPYVSVYKRSGDTFTKIANPASLPPGNAVATAFSPDGTYMSVGSVASPYVTIYKGSGTALRQLELSVSTSVDQGLGFGKDVTLYRSGPSELSLANGGSFNIQGGNLTVNGNVTGKGTALFQNSSDSTTAFQIQNAAGTSNLFVADTVNSLIGIGRAPLSGYALAVQGSVNATDNIVANGAVLGTQSLATGTSTNTGSVIKYMDTTGTIAAGDVVSLVDSSGAKVARSATVRDPKVYGVVMGGGGSVWQVAIQGFATVNVDTGAVVIGDQLVTTASAGVATVDNNATAGIIGYASTAKAAGSSGTVSVLVQTVGGQSNPSFRPTAQFNVSGTTYNTGTIAQAGNGVLGSSTAFTPAMKGGTLYYNDGTTATITSVIDGTHLSVSSSKSYSSNTYTIIYGGLNVGPTGNLTLQNSANSAAAFQIQNALGTSTLLNVDTTTLNLVTNPSFEADASNGWANASSGTGLARSRTITAANVYHGTAAQQVITASSAANTGASLTGFTASITPGTYTLSFIARASVSFSTFDVTITGGSAPSCLTGQTLTTGFQRYTCTFTSTSTDVTAINFTTSTSTQQTFYLDAVQLLSGSTSNPYTIGKIQLGGVIAGPTTFQNTSDSTTAFQIQNAAGGSLFNVDSANSNITLLGNNSGEPQPWKTATDDGSAHAYHQTAIINGYFYIFDLGASKAKVNADGSLGTFSGTAGDPLSRDSYAVATANGYVYLLGGSPNGTPTAKVTYAKPNPDGTISSWKTGIDLPGARNFGSAFVANGYLYLLGGSNGATAQTTAYYAKLNADGSYGSWNTTTALPTANYQAAATVANGYVYVTGGNLLGSGVTRNVYYAKLNNDGTGTIGAWTTVSNALPDERNLHGATVINGYLYVVGGLDDIATGESTVFYAQLNGDGSFNAFSTAATANSLPSTRASFGSLVTANGYMYVAAGNAAASSAQQSIYYTSTSRLLVGGSLDLVGLSGENLNEGGSGGTLTAGNTNIIGSLDVRGAANINQGLSVGGTLNVNGTTALNGAIVSSVLLQNSINSSSAFQVQNTAGTSILNVGTLTQTNLITNSSVESNTSGWSKLQGTQESTFATSATNPASGTQSLNVVTSTNASNQGAKYTVSNLKPNTTYLFSVYTSLGGTVGGTAYAIGANVNGSDVTCTGNGTGLTFTTAVTRWTCGFTTGATTTTTDYVFVRRASSDGVVRTMYIDSAQLETATSASNAASLFAEPPYPNLVANPDFESNINGWSAKGTSSASTAASTDYANFGSKSLKIVTGTVADNGVYYSYNFQPSSRYSLSFWARKDTGSAATFNVGRSDTAYTTGSIAQSGSTTVVGTGTTFTSSMVGKQLIYGDGTADTITAFTDTTHVTVTTSRTLNSTTNSIGYSIMLDTADCLTGQTINATWTNFTCSFTTSTTVAAKSSFYIKQTDTTSDNLYIDGVTLVASGSALSYAPPAASLQVEPLTSTVTINGANTGELGQWQTNVNVPTSALDNSTGFTANGYVYKFGGVFSFTSNSVVQYAKLNADGSVGAWGTTTPMPYIAHDVITLASNGYVYIMGGNNGNTNSLTGAYYAKLNPDGTIGTWVSTTSLPVARAGSRAFVSNGYMFMMGGYSSPGTSAYASDNAVYVTKVSADGSLGTWTSLNSLNTAASNFGSVVANGYVYVLGGWSSGNSIMSTTQYAKVNTDGTLGPWNTTTAFPAVRGRAGAVVANGYIYAIAGEDGSAARKDVLYAKLNTDGTIGTWNTSINALPTAMTGHVPIVSNGYLYAIGFDRVYYASTARLQVAGALDLVGLSGQNLAEGGSGGELTAGNTNIIGQLNVRGSATVGQSLAVGNNLSVSGSALFKNTVSSATAFQLQSPSGANYILLDTTNNKLTLGSQAADNVSYSTHQNVAPATGSSITSSSFSVSGVNPVIIVNIALKDATATVSSVSWSLGGGTPYEIKNARSGTTYVSTWAIPAPTAGSGTYTVNFSASVPYQVDAQVYNNVDQTTPSPTGDAVSTSGADVTSLTLTASNLSSNDATAAVGGNSGSAGDPTGITPNSTFFNATTAVNIQSGYRLGTGSVNGGWSLPATSTEVLVAVRLRAATITTTTIQSGTGGILLNPIGTNNTGVTVKPTNNSTAAFQIQNAGGTNLLQADSTNSIITLNGSSGGDTLAWQTNGNALPVARQSHASVTANGYIYLIGGYNSAGNNIDSIYYAQLNSNGSTGTWFCQGTTVATSCGVGATNVVNANALPAVRGDEAAVVANGYIYVMGGTANAGTTAQATVYSAKLNSDGSTSAWSTLTNVLPQKRKDPASVYSNNGYIYVTGGHNDTNTVRTTFYAKANTDGTVGSWGCIGTGDCGTATASGSNDLASSIKAHSSVISNGYMYLVGGNIGAATKYVQYAKINSDGTIGAWQCQNTVTCVNGGQVNTNATNNTHNGGTVYAANGYLYVVGGFNETSIEYARINSDGSTGSWTVSSQQLPSAAALSFAGKNGVLANGYIYVAGGLNSSTISTAVYYASLNRANAGGTDVLGQLSVRGQASIGQSLTVTGSLVANSDVLFQNATNSMTAFQVQNATGASLLTADTTNGRLSVNASFTAMSVPSSLAAAAAAGGNLTAGTYRYEVTAIDSAGGETTISNEATGTTASSNLTLNVTWTAVSGASGYKVYRTAAAGASGSEAYLTSVTANSYSDVGTSKVVTGITPPSTNTAYTSSNNVASQLQLSVGGLGSPTGQLYVSGTVPTFVGESEAVTTAGVVNGPSSIYVQGRYAYMANFNNSSFDIQDVANPARPTLVSQTIVAGSAGPAGVYVQGRYAYVINQAPNSINIYDISNPTSPALQGSANTGLSTPMTVYVQGRYAYILEGTSATDSALAILDVSNPNAPKMVGMINGGMNVNNGSGHSIVVLGTYAYVVSNNNNTLAIFDVSNPAAPTRKGSTTSNLNAPLAVAVQGRYAYVVNSNGGNMSIYDISNPASPTFVAVNSDSNISQGTDIVVEGRYAYIGSFGSKKIITYDISNPSKPTFVGQNSDSKMSVGAAGDHMAIVVQGRYAYAVTNTNANTGKLYVYDVGGAYVQQLEAGGIETGTLAVNGNGTVTGNLDIQGGLNISNNLQAAGNLGLTGGASIQGSTILGTSAGGINSLSVPSGLGVTCQGTCASTVTWTYKVTAINAYGGETTAATASISATDASTLTTANFNRISWTAVAGASGYKVYRTVSGGTPSGLGLIGTINTATNNTAVCNGTYPCFDDKNQYIANSAVTAPVVDSSGQLTVLGSTLFANTTNSTTAFQIQNAAGTSNLFVADTTNTRIGIGTNAPAATFHISSGGTDPLFRVTDTTSTARDVLNIADGGATTFRNQTDSAAGFQIQNANGSSTLFKADTNGNDLIVQANIVASGSSTATTATTSGTGVTTTTLTFTGTTSFANDDVIYIDNAGQDYYTRIVSGGTAASVTVSPAVTFENTRTVTKYNVQNIGSSTNATPASNNERFFQGYFLGGVVTGAGSTTLSDGLLQSSNSLNLVAAGASGSLNLQAGTGGITQSSTATTGTGLSVAANSLTSGNALSVSTTSNSMTSGNLAVITKNLTATSTQTDSASLLNVNRTTTSNVSGGGSIVTLNNSAFTSTGFPSTSGTLNINVTFQTNQVLLFGLFQDGSPTATVPTADIDGTPMTLVRSEYSAGGYRMDLFRVSSPAVGSRALHYAGGSGTNGAALMAATFYNVDLTALGTVGGAAQTSGQAAATFGTTSGGDKIIAFGNNSTPGGSESQVNGGTFANYITVATGTGGNVTVSRGISGTNVVAGQLMKSIVPPGTNVTGAVASFSNTCTSLSASTCTDTSNVLNLNQTFGGAKGAVLNIQNASDAADILIGSNHAGLIQSASGTTSNGINIFSGNASSGASGDISIDNGTYTSGSPSINIGSTNATQINIGNAGSTTTINGALSFSSVTLSGDTTVNSSSPTAFQIQDGSSNTALWVATDNFTSSGFTFGGDTAVLYVEASNGAISNRSINAAGSVEVGGADYAEWIPWTGPKPDQGSIVTYKGTSFVVSSNLTAGNIGNGQLARTTTDRLLVTFTGQVPVKVTGVVNEGDLLLPNGDGTAKAINPAEATLSQHVGRLGIAAATNLDAGVKLVDSIISAPGSTTLAEALQGTPDPDQSMVNLNVSSNINAANLNVSGMAQIADLQVTGTATIQNLVVTTAVFNGNITINGHIVTGGDAPTVMVESAAGTAATVQITGNDTAGTVMVTTGSTGVTAGDLAKMTFQKQFGKTPQIILSAQDDKSIDAKVYPGNKSATDFTLKTTQVLQPSTTYTFTYFILE